MKLIEEDNRNRDFYRACEEIIRHNKPQSVNVRETVRKALLSPAGSFYLSDGEIARILRSRMWEMPLNPVKLEMYKELCSRYRQLKALHPGQKIGQIARLIETQPAPRFYMSDAYAVRLYYHLVKNRKRYHPHL